MLVLLHCYCATANVTLLLFLHNHILNDYLLLYVMYTFIPIFFSTEVSGEANLTLQLHDRTAQGVSPKPGVKSRVRPLCLLHRPYTPAHSSKTGAATRIEEDCQSDSVRVRLLCLTTPPTYSNRNGQNL